ncbi:MULTISPECIES: hypothetical protein [unclassified Butyrivibrio]|uniref:hypothetical protein n=1 Tax=unclassified Butyrivibrio TaxID=2639466 RepID=UPI0003FC312F|nr:MULTISPECIES: hypothetical protein [unclassified Butyrivibrio]
MKKARRIISVGLIMLAMATACGKEKTPPATGKTIDDAATEKITIEDTAQQENTTQEESIASSGDSSTVDLTILSPTIVYGEVFQMMYYPENYIGKTVKMQGLYDIYTDESTGKTYHACIIQDATACCAQGIEFELADSDYPGTDTMEVTVEGTFATYEENGTKYCTLKDAELVN